MARGNGSGEDGGKPLGLPSLQVRQVLLRPLSPADYTPLRAAELVPPLGPRWRFRGMTPSPEEWARLTSERQLAQFIAQRTTDNVPLGLLQLHNAGFQDGHAQLSIARLGPPGPSPELIVGLGIFLRYVFYCWDFRKLYMEVPEYNYDQISSGEGKFFSVEGRFKDHLFLGGRYWDQFILAMHRETWQRSGEPLLQMEEAIA
jgi:hypothetical protein